MIAAGFGILFVFLTVFAVALFLIGVGAGLGLLRLVLALLCMHGARGVRRAPRQISTAEHFGVDHRCENRTCIKIIRDAEGVGQRRSRFEQGFEPRIEIGGHAGNITAQQCQGATHRRQRCFVVGPRLQQTHAVLDTGRMQAAQIIRHQALNAAIDAEIVAEIKQQLKPQQVFAIAFIHRCP